MTILEVKAIVINYCSKNDINIHSGFNFMAEDWLITNLYKHCNTNDIIFIISLYAKIQYARFNILLS